MAHSNLEEIVVDPSPDIPQSTNPFDPVFAGTEQKKSERTKIPPFLSKESFKEINEQVQALLVLMSKNPSKFSRLAQYLGTKSGWGHLAQYSVGGLITAGILILGMVVSGYLIAFLVAACVFALLYSATIYFLNDQFETDTKYFDELTVKVSALTKFIGNLFELMHNFSEDLSNQIERFERINNDLRNTNEDLNQSVTDLTKKIEYLNVTIEEISKSNDELTEINKNLDAVLQKTTKLFEETKLESEKDRQISSEKAAIQQSQIGELNAQVTKWQTLSERYKGQIKRLSEHCANLISSKANAEEAKKHLLAKANQTLDSSTVQTQETLDKVCEQTGDLQNMVGYFVNIVKKIEETADREQRVDSNQAFFSMFNPGVQPAKQNVPDSISSESCEP